MRTILEVIKLVNDLIKKQIHLSAVRSHYAHIIGTIAYSHEFVKIVEQFMHGDDHNRILHKIDYIIDDTTTPPDITALARDVIKMMKNETRNDVCSRDVPTHYVMAHLVQDELRSHNANGIQDLAPVEKILKRAEMLEKLPDHKVIKKTIVDQDNHYAYMGVVDQLLRVTRDTHMLSNDFIEEALNELPEPIIVAVKIIARKGANYFKNGMPRLDLWHMWKERCDTDIASKVDIELRVWINNHIDMFDSPHSVFASEAPEGAPLDRYAFAPQRDDVPTEFNNEFEGTLLDALASHFRANNKLHAKHVNIIKNFLQKGWYKKVFHEPNVRWVFRGMRVGRNYIAKALQTDDFPEEGSMGKSFTFKPYDEGTSSSWTLDVKTARAFSKSNSDEYHYGLILCARVDKNFNSFVMGPGGLYSVDELQEYASEHEVIGLGDIKVSKIFWAGISNYDAGLTMVPMSVHNVKTVKYKS